MLFDTYHSIAALPVLNNILTGVLVFPQYLAVAWDQLATALQCLPSRFELYEVSEHEAKVLQTDGGTRVHASSFIELTFYMLSDPQSQLLPIQLYDKVVAATEHTDFALLSASLFHTSTLIS